MKKVFKNYKQTIIFLLAIIIGGALGLIFKEKISVLKPLGDMFLNLMFVVLVPLIFLTIVTSIGKMDNPKRLGKIMIVSLITIVGMSLLFVLIGFVSTKINLVDINDSSKIMELMDDSISSDNSMNLLERTTSLLVTDDFSGLFSRNNVIAILVFSIIFAFALRMSKEKGKKALEVIESLNSVILNVLKIIMYYAPIGIMCYFANLVGTFGGEIVIGFFKTFIIYLIVSLVVYFIVYPAIVLIFKGKKGIKLYFKNVVAPTVTALATCSSAASIPVNIDSTKKMGVSDDIAETFVPIGTNFHKDGSIIGSVFKIMFLVYLFNSSVSPIKLIFGGIVVTLLVAAVPIGGGTISEMMILSLFNFPVSCLPILTIIATVIDPPATVLNVVGDSVGALVVSRFVDGKKK